MRSMILIKICRKILEELGSYFEFFLRNLPGILGRYLRYLIYKRLLSSCGKKVYIPPFVFFKGFKNIELGSNVSFSPFNTIFAESSTSEARIKIGNNVSFNFNVMINADAKGEIILEDNVMIGPNVVLRSSGHKYEDLHVPIRQQGHVKGIIIIREGVWIGANAVILPNVVIGKGAIVGAGAVVTKDVGDFDIAGGVPAKKIGSRIKNGLHA